MNKNFVSRQQLSLLPERIRKAEETGATKELYSYLLELCKKKKSNVVRVLIVGTGGSYPVALFVEHLIINKMNIPNVEATTPQTALRKFDKNFKYDLVIGISYSGRTPDIKAVYEECKKRRYPFLLFTGESKCELQEIYQEDMLIKIVSYFNSKDNSGKEKSMISMASTLIPVVLFEDYTSSTSVPQNSFKIYEKCLEEAEKSVSKLNISNVAIAIKKYPVVHVFYEWEMLPTATDIESKFIESGIANVVLHEKKNFSHGRNTVLSTQDFGLVINLIKYQVENSYLTDESKKYYNNDYDKNLADFLKDICKSKLSSYYLEFGNCSLETTQWNIREMCKLPYLITEIGEKLNIDIAKPLVPFPKKAIGLYNYKGIF